VNKTDKIVIVKNAIANVGRGSAAALVAVLLPPFLTRLMSSDAFGAWSLVLQLSAFVGYLDFGIQTAIGRFVAHANERKNPEQRDRIISTSAAALTVSGAIGVAGIVVIALLAPRIFHQVPPVLLHELRIALVLVAGSLAVGLPCSVFNGIFIGLQRYEVPSAIVAGSRAVSAVCLVLVVRRGGSLIQMGVAAAAVNLASYLLQYIMYRALAPRVKFSARLVSRQSGRELFDYCFSLSVWSFAMLLVTGLDVSMVGYFEFRKVAYYAVAATLITFLAGLQNAVFHVMIPSTAVLQARGDSAQLGRTVLTATRYGCFILLLTGLPLIFGAREILNLWVGAKYALEGARILQVLTVANMIRLSAVPYVMTLIGTGQQRLVVLTPLMEGFSNLVASVIGGYYFGAIGIAFGTLVGGVVGVAGNFVYNMPRTLEVQFRISNYVRDGLLRPLICALPVISVILGIHLSEPFASARMLLIGVAGVSTIVLVWYWGLAEAERQRLRHLRFVFQN
jgi:O-antigen/teichoic acid export membrane protein